MKLIGCCRRENVVARAHTTIHWKWPTGTVADIVPLPPWHPAQIVRTGPTYLCR